MWFKSEEHSKSYADLKSRARTAGDVEYLAALYVLGAIGKNVSEYVYPGGIRFKRLAEDSASWSSGEKALIRLAATLFNSLAWPVTVQDVFCHLDRDNARVALEALKIRYCWD